MGKAIVISPRKVAFTANKYVITVPRAIGEKLHGKLVKVIIEPIELSEGDG